MTQHDDGTRAARRWLDRAGPGGDLDAVWRGFLTAAGRERDQRLRAPEGSFPHVTDGDTWQLLNVNSRSATIDGHYRHGNWTAGFATGVQWLSVAGTGDPEPAKLARQDIAQIAMRADDHTTHDLGFLFYPSVALGRLVGGLETADERNALTAARTLAARFNPRTGLIQAFGPIGEPHLAGTSTIDTMMNLPLLWWASGRGADPAVVDTFRQHARTAARLYLRPDGSTYHMLHVDPISGALLERGTFQGADAESCWSRGQAWAICGFAWAYAATGERELLDAAGRAAEYFFDHLPEHAVPPWDFTAAGADDVADASAAAAVALGCLLLAEHHPDIEARATNRDAAARILTELGHSCLNTKQDRDGILQHSCYSKPHGTGLDAATGWGDFYFGLALACATGTLATADL